MSPEDQLAEIASLFPGAAAADEAGVRYYHLPRIRLRETLAPSEVDGLLCPSARDGYPTRLFLSSVVAGAPVNNWRTFWILGKNWHAFSWDGVDAALRLAEMAGCHLRPLL